MRRFSQRSYLVTLSEINITPLLDLAFVLLIIFVITTPLLEQSIDLKLPRGGQPDKSVNKRDIRTVEISSTGVLCARQAADAASAIDRAAGGGIPRRTQTSSFTSARTRTGPTNTSRDCLMAASITASRAIRSAPNRAK